MKKLIVLLIILCAAPAMAVTLAWDANTDSATGYIVYYQQAGSDTIYHETVTPAGRETTTYTIDNSKFVPGSENSFWLTAYNEAAESGPSNIVTWTAPEFTPTDDPAPVIIQIPGAPKSIVINIGADIGTADPKRR